MKEKCFLIFMSILILSFSVFAGNEYNVDANTVGLWKFNEGSGVLTLNEKTNLNASIYNSQWVDGLVSGNALRFYSGSGSSYVKARYVNIKGPITIEATIKPEQVSGTRSIVDNLYNYAFYIEQGKLIFGVFDKIKGLKKATSLTSLEPNVAYQVAGTYDSVIGEICVYINNVKESCTVSKVNYWLNGLNLYIGQGYQKGNLASQFIGTIDNLRISNITRTFALNTFTVLSDAQYGQVVAEVDALFIKTIQVDMPSTNVLVDLPADASIIEVKVNGLPYNTFTVENTGTEILVDLVVDSNIDTYEINYVRHGPTKEESINFEYDAKEITVSSDIPYTNVLTRTKIDPLPQNLVRLEHLDENGNRVQFEVTNYIDLDNDGLIDEVEWIVPHLSNETFEISLQTSFNNQRLDHPNLPVGWYVQADGQSETDDGCLDVNAWTLINEKFSGSKGIMYISLADTIGCGIKLPNFFPPITGKVTATFNFKTNFTNPDSYMEILNYGKDNCNIGFNANNVVKQVECNAAITDAGKGWKTLTITNWVVLSTNKVDLYVSPPFILNQIGETGVMIFDDLSMEIE